MGGIVLDLNWNKDCGFHCMYENAQYVLLGTMHLKPLSYAFPLRVPFSPHTLFALVLPL